MQQEKPKRTSYGAWKKQTPKGEVINFTLKGQRYNMWFNSQKTQEKQPDYNIYEDNYVSPNQAVQTQDVQAQVVQTQPAQQPQSGFVPASNGLNF
jgi:ABC-type metal ion transport system substrate-binding protein